MEIPMDPITLDSFQTKVNLYKWAFALALITIFYNIVEGGVSILFGLKDETLSLFGFGIDSFVEVISGIGVWHMIRRMKQNKYTEPDRFERNALRITGSAFYILTIGLIVTAVTNLYQAQKPETTFWGIVIATLSICSMWALVHYKVRIGSQLNSQAILADANCTKTCIYLSVILLVASVGYEVTEIGGVDSFGALIIAGLSFREGRESFQKAKGVMCSCSGSCHNNSIVHSVCRDP